MKQCPVTEHRYKEMEAQTDPGEREAHRLGGTFVTHNVISLCMWSLCFLSQLPFHKLVQYMC